MIERILRTFKRGGNLGAFVNFSSFLDSNMILFVNEMQMKSATHHLSRKIEIAIVEEDIVEHDKLIIIEDKQFLGWIGGRSELQHIMSFAIVIDPDLYKVSSTPTQRKNSVRYSRRAFL